MKTVVYLDVLLLVNFIIGVFLLLAAGALAGVQVGFWRSVAGGVLAALAALVLLLPEMPYPAQLGYRLFTGGIIVLAACGWHGWQRFTTALCWYTALNLLTAGLAILVILQTGTPLLQAGNLTVYLRVSPLLLVGCCALCWALAELFLHLGSHSRKPVAGVGVEFVLGGTPLRLRAALDTGCHLKDPLTCLPVLLISYPDAKPRLPPTVCSYLDGWYAGEVGGAPPPGLRLRLIPCTTAEGDSLLPGFSVEDIGVIPPKGKGGVQCLGRTAIAFARRSFGSEAYEALYGSDFL
ncbi:MAG: sigma-E processing peptidase SpoIIGA [Pygmaiobacter sp.]|nr:sigma-E processing peptidase SpoIIGA [Pygmaiobacter sp.]